jgi:phosphonate transport system permease protein
MSGATEPKQSVPSTWERPSAFSDRRIKWFVYGIIIIFVIWSAWEMRPSLARLLGGLSIAGDLLVDMIPPNFGPRERGLIVTGIIETIAIANVATVLGILISVPVAFMAAENVSSRPSYVVGRGLISVSRGFHELIVAIIAVVAVGFGPLAGVIALVFNTVGFYAKLLAEEIEDMDMGQVEAVRATGGSPLQIFMYGVIPQVMPRIIGLTIYRWDINLRKSTIVGIVGAGGIGWTLVQSFEVYEYDFTLAILLVIIGIVLIGEAISAIVRKRVN